MLGPQVVNLLPELGVGRDLVRHCNLTFAGITEPGYSFPQIQPDLVAAIPRLMSATRAPLVLFSLTV
jgi:hypothetical protein